MRLITAAAVALLSLTLSGRLAAQSPTTSRPADSTLVVFVCEHGTVKSQVAAALFNRLAVERRLPARAVSRGTQPDSVIPQLIRDGLRADGVDVSGVLPKGLSTEDARGARMFVAFDVEVPGEIAGVVPVRRWDGTPSVMQAYPVGRDAIAARVASLVSELEHASPQPPGQRP